MDEEKSVGTYELSGMQSILPSGVYFYQLKGRRLYRNKEDVIVKIIIVVGTQLSRVPTNEM